MVIVGYRQPAWVHALAHAVNDALGAYAAEEKDKTGRVTTTGSSSSARRRPKCWRAGIAELTKDMAAGKVKTLLVIGGNPSSMLLPTSPFSTSFEKVETKIRLGLFHDHTSEACDWHLPLLSLARKLGRCRSQRRDALVRATAHCSTQW